MKMFADKVNDVKLSNIDKGVSFDVEDGGKFVLTVLRNTYSDPVGATVREIAQNASEVDPNFSIHIPTSFEPWLAIRDNGTGLSPDDTERYFSKLGASTKDKDNTKVGGFGAGAKVLWAVTDDYTVTSRWNGRMYTFFAYTDDYGRPMFSLAGTAHTDEPNGIEVRVPVKLDQVEKYKKACVQQLEFFDPKPTLNIDLEWPERETIMSGKGYTIQKREYGYPYNRDAESRLVMGNLSYPIDPSKFEHKYQRMLQSSRVILFAPIGSCTLPMSRESLLYDDKTTETIERLLDTVRDDYRDKVQPEVDKCDTLAQAYNKAGELRNTYVQMGGSSDDLKGLTYNGKPIEHPKLSCNIYSLDRSRLHLKSLNVRDYKRSNYRFKWLDFNEEGEVVILGEDVKKLPSTILHNAAENGWRHVIYVEKKPDGIDEDGNTVRHPSLKVIERVLKNAGLTVLWFRELEEPPKAVRAMTSKTMARIKLHDGPDIVGYNESFRWMDHQINDLDKDTGVYVELKNYVPKDDTERQNLRKFFAMRKTGVIPVNTKLFGIPGNVKNTLKDHANYISVTEAVELAEQTLKSVVSKFVAKKIEHDAIMEALSSYRCYSSTIKDRLFQSNVQGTYIHDLLMRLSKLKAEYKTHENDVAFYVSNFVDDYHEQVEKKENAYKRELDTKYRLLKYVDNNVSPFVLAEYINMMEKN